MQVTIYIVMQMASLEITFIFILKKLKLWDFVFVFVVFVGHLSVHSHQPILLTSCHG